MMRNYRVHLPFMFTVVIRTCEGAAVPFPFFESVSLDLTVASPMRLVSNPNHVYHPLVFGKYLPRRSNGFSPSHKAKPLKLKG